MVGEDRMTDFRGLTAEEVAAQHQMLIDLILHVMSQGSDDLRERFAQSIDKRIVGRAEQGLDTTILADAAASLRRRNDEA
jgi:hypothetical protein